LQNRFSELPRQANFVWHHSQALSTLVAQVVPAEALPAHLREQNLGGGLPFSRFLFSAFLPQNAQVIASTELPCFDIANLFRPNLVVRCAGQVTVFVFYLNETTFFLGVRHTARHSFPFCPPSFRVDGKNLISYFDRLDSLFPFTRSHFSPCRKALVEDHGTWSEACQQVEVA
jgi:hypothetical protein